MPELPEVEHLRRTLEPLLLGRRVVDATLHRRDVLRLDANDRRSPHRRTDLLVGRRLVQLRRRGKQLSIHADDDTALVVHLGMSGQVLHLAPGARADRADHVHATWRLDDASRLLFRDPRRFGGLWAIRSSADLDRRLAPLGPDALEILAPDLHRRLGRTTRAVKAALLDQRLVAGVGNIYADEALHIARIHPLRPGASLARDETRALARALRAVLRAAIDDGGSTLRDYRDATGRSGRRQNAHAVYGRAGRSCLTCGTTLEALSVTQRTTVFCPHCQPAASRHARPISVGPSGLVSTL